MHRLVTLTKTCDALIGNIVAYLTPRHITTYEELVEAMMSNTALKNNEGKAREVIPMYGITDYDEKECKHTGKSV